MQQFHARHLASFLGRLDAARNLDLEITESLLLQRNDDNIATLRQLSAMGLTLSVDDFGTGYSSLAYLQRYPINTLKIDQSFVRGIAQNANDPSLVITIIAMARSLNLGVLAEGVETPQQAAFLMEHTSIAMSPKDVGKARAPTISLGYACRTFPHMAGPARSPAPKSTASIICCQTWNMRTSCIRPATTVWAPGTAPLPPKPWFGRGIRPTRLRREPGHGPVAVKALAMALPQEAWRTVSWREGSNAELSSRFAMVRVRPAHRDYRSAEMRAEAWLLIEWPAGDAEPRKYFLSTAPADATIDQLVFVTKRRWRIERDYQERKQEFGLSHYEGAVGRDFITTPRCVSPLMTSWSPSASVKAAQKKRRSTKSACLTRR